MSHSHTNIVFVWEASPFFGWGVYGLNLALFGNNSGFNVLTAYPVKPENWGIDAARRWALAGFVERSKKLGTEITSMNGTVALKDSLVIRSLNNELKPSSLVDGRKIRGTRNWGIAFIESSKIQDRHLERVSEFELIIAGSQWNMDLLKGHRIDHVKLVLQGIDTSLFHPAPRLNIFKDRFAVFSGGKVEFRKSQDLVLAAFKIFRERHKDALLVTAWHSPWAKVIAPSMSSAQNTAPVKFDRSGDIDACAWAAANGIPAEDVLDLGAVPNAQLPSLLREMDAAIFPNRCEGGTNLVAMEVMACGIPTILSANTGHLDLIAEENCYPLLKQGKVNPPKGIAVDGWGESDVDEIVDHLEQIYTDRQMANDRGLKGAESVGSLSWKNQIQQLLSLA